MFTNNSQLIAFLENLTGYYLSELVDNDLWPLSSQNEWLAELDDRLEYSLIGYSEDDCDRLLDE